MTETNLGAAWAGILLGSLAGAGAGLFFRGEDWLGGYGSWPRRMLRLGHISFFGIAFINIAFALTARTLNVETEVGVSSTLLLVGAVAMPTVCYLAAIRDTFRHLFFVPTLSVIAGVAVFLWTAFAR